MSSAHFHLLTGHFPFVSASLAVLLLLLGCFRRTDRGLWLAATLLLVVTAVTAVASNLSGAPAEASVVGRPGVDASFIPGHEIRGDLATLSAVVSALASSLVLFLSRRGDRPASARAAALLILSSLVTAGLLGWTGLAGGKIRHDEIRSVAPR